MSIARLGAMPSDLSQAKLIAGNNYTISLRFSGLLQPSEASVKFLLTNSANLGLFFENVTVTRPLFSQEYTINFRIKKSIDLGTLMRVLTVQMPDYSITDFRTGFQQAPTIIERVVPVTQLISEPLSAIKWIVIASLGLYALFIFSPMLKTILPKK